MSDSLWSRLVQRIKSFVGTKAFRGSGSAKQTKLPQRGKVYDLTHLPKARNKQTSKKVPGLSVIKSLVRELRYCQIKSLVDTTIMLSSIEAAPAEVRAKISSLGIEIESILENPGVLSFNKYGLLDFEYQVIKTSLPIERQSVRFLRDLGVLIDSHELLDSVFIPDDGVWFLDDMLQDIREEKLVLKIMLDCQSDFPVKLKDTSASLYDNPNKYFPSEFKVRDACITNCGLVWLCKHFYL